MNLLPEPLLRIASEIKSAFDARLYYPALTVALTLPEICVGLGIDDPKRHINNKDYAAFIDRYTTPRDLGLDGASCYKLRCGVIHRGNAAGHAFIGVTHVIFTVHGTGQMHGFVLDHKHYAKNALMLSLEAFCTEMERAAIRWYADNRNDPVVRQNIPAIMSLRPNGIFPFVDGAVVGSGAEVANDEATKES